MVGNAVPHIWLIGCDPGRLGLRHALIEQADPVLTIAHLLADPDDRNARIRATPLLLEQGGRDLLLPDEGTLLQPGDRLLFAGAAGAEALQSRLLVTTSRSTTFAPGSNDRGPGSGTGCSARTSPASTSVAAATQADVRG